MQKYNNNLQGCRSKQKTGPKAFAHANRRMLRFAKRAAGPALTKKEWQVVRMIAYLNERRVLTYGIFAGFGVAEARHLRRLAHMGERLVVGLASDELAASLFKTSALPAFADRRDVLLACRHVDRVVAWTHLDQARTDIVNYNISLLAVDDLHQVHMDGVAELAQVLVLPWSDPLDSEIETISAPKTIITQIA